ncbi:MAG: YmaF family protein [Clostridia bacterium]|nr:YmaF family protein [Clostridia bacterium]
MKYKDALNTIKRYPLNYSGNCSNIQSHVHEFVASTKLAETGHERHNHRIAGITGEAIPIGNGHHIHKFCTRTDFYDDHFHEVLGSTCPDIDVTPEKHIHYVQGHTTVDDNHKHRYEFTTQIGPSPLT